LLEGSEFISPRSWLTLARSLVLLDDLTKAEKFKQSSSSKQEKLNILTQAHRILIEQVKILLCLQDLEICFSEFFFLIPNHIN
jgi:hypothetical protein